MNRRAFLKTLPALGVLAATTSGSAQDPEPITLAKPQTEGGKSLKEGLANRQEDGNSVRGECESMDPTVLHVGGSVFSQLYDSAGSP